MGFTFENACNCIVDYRVLEKAIKEECTRRGVIPKNHYKIYLYRGYAGISIKHDKVSVHRIIGKHISGWDIPSNMSVHHIDGNKLNNDVSNLQIIRNDLHTKKHNTVQHVDKSVLAKNAAIATEKRKRKDVSIEKVKALREKGYTIPQIAKELSCGYNTVCRRIQAIDWSDYE